MNSQLNEPGDIPRIPHGPVPNKAVEAINEALRNSVMRPDRTKQGRSIWSLSIDGHDIELTLDKDGNVVALVSD